MSDEAWDGSASAGGSGIRGREKTWNVDCDGVGGLLSNSHCEAIASWLVGGIPIVNSLHK